MNVDESRIRSSPVLITVWLSVLLVAVAPKQEAYNTLPSLDVNVYFK